MFLDNNTFETVIDSTPLISIDLVVRNPKGHALLGYRTNRPAKDHWFVPGGRILKSELMKNAFTRLCQQELGLDFSLERASFLGLFEHFYDDSVFGEHLSTHYVVLGYEITVDESQLSLPSEQHSQYQWFDVDTLLTQDNVHQHSKWYFI
ncbi:GDP-mannose mannosyl hydrolase [Shewanella frigidimarina]|uniref:GDP-mannose mannosyl hydrolase n=1 Tax=Shewanella frigidimarina TaxID=56812 RepID=UPI003D7BF306